MIRPSTCAILNSIRRRPISSKKSTIEVKLADITRSERVKPYLDRWIELLCLDSSWQISYDFKRLSNGRFAEIDVLDPYRKALVHFDRRCLDTAQDAELNIIVVHELLHLIVHPVRASVISLLNCSTIGKAITDSLEGVIDHVAQLLTIAYGDPDPCFYDSIPLVPEKEGD